MDTKIGEIIKQRVAMSGMSKAELARRLHMSPANVHKIFKRSSVDVTLLRELSRILDYDFLQHFQPDVSRPGKEPLPYQNVGDIEVLFIRYIVDLQSRVQVLEEHWDAFRSIDKTGGSLEMSLGWLRIAAQGISEFLNEAREEDEAYMRRGYTLPRWQRKIA